MAILNGLSELISSIQFDSDYASNCWLSAFATGYDEGGKEGPKKFSDKSWGKIDFLTKNKNLFRLFEIRNNRDAEVAKACRRAPRILSYNFTKNMKLTLE